MYGDPILLKFEIETVNNLSYLYLFSTAITILINKLKLLITNIESNDIMIEPIPNNPFSVKNPITNIVQRLDARAEGLGVIANGTGCD